MKHRPLDLASEIERASLPSKLEGFLFPVFEAVSNALHSIDDRFGQESHEKGRIRIEFDSDKKRILVVDNGDGFNINNTNAFLTPFTGNKLRRNGKGFGRYISFKIFNNVFYASPTETSENVFANATYEYKPLGKTTISFQSATIL